MHTYENDSYFCTGAVRLLSVCCENNRTGTNIINVLYYLENAYKRKCEAKFHGQMDKNTIVKIHNNVLYIFKVTTPLISP